MSTTAWICCTAEQPAWDVYSAGGKSTNNMAYVDVCMNNMSLWEHLLLNLAKPRTTCIFQILEIPRWLDYTDSVFCAHIHSIPENGRVRLVQSAWEKRGPLWCPVGRRRAVINFSKDYSWRGCSLPRPVGSRRSAVCSVQNGYFSSSHPCHHHFAKTFS